MRIKLLLISILAFTFSNAQNDSLKIGQEDFLFYLLKYHPLSKQADLILKRGQAEYLSAKGGFDPKLSAQAEQKQFDGKNYYQLMGGALSLPTKYGVEFKAGYDQNLGIRLNPENSLPDQGLGYAGISIPLGNGLFYDQRRANLAQAEIKIESTQAQANHWLNELVFQGLKAYWDWVAAYHQVQVYQRALGLAQARFEGVKSSHFLGDLPAIDTVEAKVQVQARSLALEEAKINFQKSRLELSSFLWFQDEEPIQVSPIAQAPEILSLSQDSQSRFNPRKGEQPNLKAHPELLKASLQIKNLQVEERLKKENLKPELDINYNFLGSQGVIFDAPNNYKFGISFSYPLFLRKARGDLEIARLKVQESEFQFNQKSWSLENKVSSVLLEIDNLENQVELFENAVENYRRLLRAERTKFKAGESSLFLVNSRENALVQAEIKLITLQKKLEIARIKYWYAYGALPQLTQDLIP